MDADLEVLATRLVDVRSPDNAVAVDPGRQWHRPLDLRLRSQNRLRDLARGLVDHRVVVSLESDPNPMLVVSHLVARFFLDLDLGSRRYLMILVTRPAPTVRPPSRIANRRPSSIAIGAINSTRISVLSPGITISVPSAKRIEPVTSVVRK